MPNIGISELVVILLILILVFGASRLPALGEGLGRAIRSFKRGINQDENIEVTGDGAKEQADASKRVTSGQERIQGKVTDAEIVDEEKR
jgi:sec-independent protein translocase protein TatA